jgi:hypothetical protein
VVGAASLVVRFRHAHAVERQQLRWVALAAAPLALMVPIVVAGSATESPGLLDELLAVCVAPMPLAIAAAILRYRLYDLDRIISRTLTYGLLTVLLGGRLRPSGNASQDQRTTGHPVAPGNRRQLVGPVRTAAAGSSEPVAGR